MHADTLQKAIKALSIQDVYIRDHLASCSEDFDPKYAENLDLLVMEQMHLVKQANVVELADKSRLLKVYIRLGARWREAEQDDHELAVRAVIEAEFVAEYQMREDLDQDCIDEFSLKNASYHIWPYWRELLSNQCNRMNLPRLILPIVQFAQNQQDKSEETNRTDFSDT